MNDKVLLRKIFNEAISLEEFMYDKDDRQVRDNFYGFMGYLRGIGEVVEEVTDDD